MDPCTHLLLFIQTWVTGEVAYAELPRLPLSTSLFPSPPLLRWSWCALMPAGRLSPSRMSWLFPQWDVSSPSRHPGAVVFWCLSHLIWLLIVDLQLVAIGEGQNVGRCVRCGLLLITELWLFMFNGTFSRFMQMDMKLLDQLWYYKA